ncbi:DUF1156 domain-containing protein [Candidatus Poribacteria bacterium]|nr:DUF1156 domain-containing protein [Candidatus Poribacteria bacterium]
MSSGGFVENKKRIIEVSFPVEEVSEQGRRDRYKQQITGIHTWWARRPLGPSRATAYAALVDNGQFPNTSVDENGVMLPPKHDFITQLSKWENVFSPIWINQAREDILNSHEGKPPKILDPFGGGGSIPLEAQRLGCDTYSCDLNPVAVLIQKCTLEYPQKYGKRLYNDVKKWGDSILQEVKTELDRFYFEDAEGSISRFFIWARTLPCQNPGCAIEIPLVRQYWLAKKKKITLFPNIEHKHVNFSILGGDYGEIPEGFDPTKGTVIRAIVTCPICNSAITANHTRQLFQDGQAGEQMLAVVTQHQDIKGRRYRLAADDDITRFNEAHLKLLDKRKILTLKWGLDPVPDEPTPSGTGGGAERFVTRCPNYNMTKFGDLFNSRQQLALVVMAEKIRDAHPQMLSQGMDPEYTKVVSTYLGLWQNQLADNLSNLCQWVPASESLGHVFSGPGLIITWDYAEGNALEIAENRLKTLLKPLVHLSEMQTKPVTVKQTSVTNLPYLDNTFDGVLTDPPYYDNVPYSYLSDFFYVWLKRSIGQLYPDFFSKCLTPKVTEIVAYGHRDGGLDAGMRFFEDNLSCAFSEIHRVLKPNGIAVIVYAHKSTEGWETMINALLDSRLVITGAWPIDTEMKSRYVAQNAASLASSIYMVARKTERVTYGIYQDVKQELEEYLKQKLFTLWEWGFSGADLFIASIGLGIEIFGKYESIIDDDDDLIRADRMIEDIREILERFAGNQTGLAGTQLTRFYLRWREEFGETTVIFNDARELALSLGIELTDEWGEESFIQQDKTNVKVLGPQARELDTLYESNELIDLLHQVLILWSSGKRELMIHSLVKESVGMNDLMWNVAQKISNVLSADSLERQWIEGWLADRDTIQREILEAQDSHHRDTLFI